ncbi:hypothetical protein ABZ172_15695 [Streptomyces sp. NPDC006296]|uniref:hypothetical protein n=1 Tax=Streptomyces sp. NPDC006296 TaxID=3156746 RepID=UPI0033AF53C5
MLLERGTARRAGSEAERLHHALDLACDVRDDELSLDTLLVLLPLFRGRQFRLLVVAHQLSPKSS